MFYVLVFGVVVVGVVVVVAVVVVVFYVVVFGVNVVGIVDVVDWEGEMDKEEKLKISNVNKKIPKNVIVVGHN